MKPRNAIGTLVERGFAFQTQPDYSRYFCIFESSRLAGLPADLKANNYVVFQQTLSQRAAA
jgi:hypothetical protein